MKKRIMSIDELYSFCKSNKFSKFTSDDSTEIVVEMPGNFQKFSSDDEKHKEGLTPFVSRAFHDKVNLNHSSIKEDTFEENLPSANFRPILAHIVKDKDTDELDFGSHDYHVEEETQTDEDGNEIIVEKLVYDESPIGVIDGTQNSIEYDEEADVNRAVLHGYLYNEYCQDAINILNRRGTVDCSVELCVRSLSYDVSNDVLVLEDFYVAALTLLGEKVNPGMAGSNFKIEDFSVKTSSVEFNKDEKLIELLEKLNETISIFNKEQNNFKEGGITTVDKEKDLTFEDEVTETEDVTVTEDTTEEEDVTTTETESDDTTVETSEDETESEDDIVIEESVEDQDDTENFESHQEDKMVRSFEISHEDTRYALYNLLASYEDADNEWYYITNVYDSYFVYESWSGDKIYRQAYTKDEESDTVAFDGERIELFKELLTASEKAELESMRANYAALKEFKDSAEKNELHVQKQELIDSEKYSVLAEKDESGKYINPDFAKLVSEMDNYSLTDFETQIKVMHSDFISSTTTFAAKEEPKKKVLFMSNSKSEKESKKKAPYGGIFEKYNK